jgi:hypothetical protein
MAWIYKASWVHRKNDEPIAGGTERKNNGLLRCKPCAQFPAPIPDTTIGVEDPIVFEDQFNHDEAMEIPDGSTLGLETEVHVLGVPNIQVEVVFAMDVLHDAPEELQLEL